MDSLSFCPYAPWRLHKNSWETHSGRRRSLFRLQSWNVPQGQEVLWLFPLYTGRQKGVNREKNAKVQCLKAFQVPGGSVSLNQLEHLWERQVESSLPVCSSFWLSRQFLLALFFCGRPNTLKMKAKAGGCEPQSRDKDLVVRHPGSQNKRWKEQPLLAVARF